MIKNRRVVVADGDANLRWRVARALRELHLEPLVATSGAEAVELMAWRPVPGLIVCSRDLPDMSAGDLERIVRESDLAASFYTYDPRVFRKATGFEVFVDEMRRRLNVAA